MKKYLSLNYYFLLLGIFAIYASTIDSEKNTPKDNELKSLEVELSSGIIKDKRATKDVDYKFWVKEYPALFIIKNGSVPIGKYKKIKSLKKGDLAVIQINDLSTDDLYSKDSEIMIYSLYVDDDIVLSNEDVKDGRKKYWNRMNVIILFIGVMLTLNGLIDIDKKINSAIAISFILSLILMAIFKIGLY
ncbi:MAG: hypothetical protein K0R51_3442 [Cytophagaceae bacterium]|jgi:hypothetical protein|nr:hypothetical protein [Cytophagaceae bacterium]